MSTNTAATASASTTVTDDAPLIPGRKEILKSFADLALAGLSPEPTAAGDAPANAEGKDGGKPSDLSQSKAAPTGAGASAEAKAAEAQELTELTERATANGWTVEEQRTAETKALEELTARAKANNVTVEEQFAAEEKAETEKSKGEDHLADDADLKKSLTPEIQESINKRIGKEVAKTKAAVEASEALKQQVADLQQQLAQKPAVQTPGAAPLSHVTDDAGLKAEKTKAQQMVSTADELLMELVDNPETVEQTLRENKVDLKEFTAGEMKKYLGNLKRNAQKFIDEIIPQRAEYLTKANDLAAQAVNIMPELKDPKSARRAMFDRIITDVPAIKDHPAWPLAAMAQVLGMERLQEMLAAKKQPVVVKPRVKPVVIPSPKAQPPAVPKPKPNDVDPDTAKAALNGDKNARRKILQGLV